jgi:hypothetical protein
VWATGYYSWNIFHSLTQTASHQGSENDAQADCYANVVGTANVVNNTGGPVG